MARWDMQEERGLDSVPLNISAHMRCGGIWKFPPGKRQSRAVAGGAAGGGAWVAIVRGQVTRWRMWLMLRESIREV